MPEYAQVLFPNAPHTVMLFNHRRSAEAMHISNQYHCVRTHVVAGSLACSFAPPQEAPDDPGKPAKKAGMVMAVAVVPGRSAGSVLGAGYEDGAVRLWDVRKPGEETSLVSRGSGDDLCDGHHDSF